MNKISSLATLILLVVGLGLNASDILSLIGSRGLLALLLFIIGARSQAPDGRQPA